MLEIKVKLDFHFKSYLKGQNKNWKEKKKEKKNPMLTFCLKL